MYNQNLKLFFHYLSYNPSSSENIIKKLWAGRSRLIPYSDQVSPISQGSRLRRLKSDWGQMGCINVRFGGKFTTFSPRRLSDTGSKLRSNLAAAPELFRRILRAGWLIKWQIVRPSFTTTYWNDERRILIISLWKKQIRLLIWWKSYVIVPWHR